MSGLLVMLRRRPVIVGKVKKEYSKMAVSVAETTVRTFLTLRRLMSYIYIYMEHPFLMFLDHTQRRSIVGRTPLDE